MRDRIISEIRRIAVETGKAPGIANFEQLTGIARREWMGKIWARWGDAIQEAGHQPNKLTVRYDSNKILVFVAECSISIGRLASSNDLRLYGRQNVGSPSQGTVESHFPRRMLLIEALRVWAVSPENEKYSSVLEMLPKQAESVAQSPNTRSDGSVYLIKSGNYYKIGRSSEIERRVKEIRVALPQAATLEHTISTDDPPGIEAYWHRRFADRRANGEWFELSKADVLAFKKRKFQ